MPRAQTRDIPSPRILEASVAKVVSICKLISFPVRSVIIIYIYSTRATSYTVRLKSLVQCTIADGVYTNFSIRNPGYVHLTHAAIILFVIFSFHYHHSLLFTPIKLTVTTNNNLIITLAYFKFLMRVWGLHTVKNFCDLVEGKRLGVKITPNLVLNLGGVNLKFLHRQTCKYIIW